MAVITADVAKSALYETTPVETISQFKVAFDTWHRQNGFLFKDREQSEYFFMLPLNKQQRLTLLETLKEERFFIEKLRTCDGLRPSEQSQAHRNLCLNCVLTKMKMNK